MSDLHGALAAGQMVADTLFIQNWGDHMRRMAEQNGVLAQNAVLTQQLARLSLEYDRLVEQYNQFANLAVDTTWQADATIVDLQRRLAASELAREKAENEVAFLRAIEEVRSEADRDRCANCSQLR